MGKKAGKNYYAVRVGRTPGIYQSWPDCEDQVRNHFHLRLWRATLSYLENLILHEYHRENN